MWKVRHDDETQQRNELCLLAYGEKVSHEPLPDSNAEADQLRITIHVFYLIYTDVSVTARQELLRAFLLEDVVPELQYQVRNQERLVW